MTFFQRKRLRSAWISAKFWLFSQFLMGKAKKEYPGLFGAQIILLEFSKFEPRHEKTNILVSDLV